MPDIIQLLPENVANQIAAGEVVQRPASAVKEMLENAIDSGATKIQLILKDAGKTLIQVIDNGSGMSLTDARMCFERHATSKVRKAEDLFAIRTFGFRGEAMASIAAIAQVELKTRLHDEELGTLIRIEGGNFIDQEPVATTAGTSISVKNLFFNTPARRNFLKSNSAEMRHIMDEFQRVVLPNPHIAFTLVQDGLEIFRLPAATLKQRIVHLFGNNYNERLIPVEEDTTILKLKGFIGKPEFAKKTRGDQFFFVNNRFIKDAYLNHAVMKAYQDLLPDDNFPLYVLFIDMDPANIDVNVHPTKTEIKYLDERSVYAIVHAAIKRSLGKFNISPSLDFNQETGFSNMISPKKHEDIIPPSISFNPNFNPFQTSSEPNYKSGNNGFTSTRLSGKDNWSSLYQINEETIVNQQSISIPEEPITYNSAKQYMQIHNKYIISQIKSGVMVIDQQGAHERVLFEKFIEHLENQQGSSQQLLFPQTIHLSSQDYELTMSILPEILNLGFQIREFGKNTLVIEGVPVDIGNNHIQPIELFEKLIEGYKNSQQDLKIDKREALAKSLARNSAIKTGSKLSLEEMHTLIEQLFTCKMPNFSVNGKAIIQTITIPEIDKRFEK